MAKFDNLNVGGTNLIKQSIAQKGLRLSHEATPLKDTNHMLTDWIKIEPSTVYTFTTYEDVNEAEMYYSLAWYSTNSADYSGWISRPTGAASAANLKGGKQYTSPTNASYAKVSYPIKYSKVKLERGNISTDYSQNGVDFEQKVAEYKQNADQNYASLQTTVQNLDGTVQHNKTVADQTAEGFKTRIESLETYKDGETTRANQYFELAKTETARQLTVERTAIAKDYVAKSTYTSDVTGIRNELTATTTTANTIKTNLANYQATNDKVVASLQSNLQEANGNISSLKTKVEAVPGQITSAVSAVEGKIPTNIGTVNLIKQSTAQKGVRLAVEAGTLPDSKHELTDWIKIEPSTVYTLTTYEDVNEAGMYYSLAWYSTNSADYSGWISRPTGAASAANLKGGKQYTSPTNASYAKVSYPIKYSKVKLERGNISTDYNPNPEDYDDALTQVSSELKQTADGITLLATKTELNAAKNELQSGINTATNKANNNAQTISTHTTQISALNTGLSAKVSQTDFNTLSGRVTTAENNITVKANELSSKISSVEGKIPTNLDSLNLMTGTRDWSTKTNPWHMGEGWSTENEEYQGLKVHSTQKGWNGSHQNIFVKSGDVVTFSFFAKATNTLSRITVISRWDGSSVYQAPLAGVKESDEEITVTNEWKRYSKTVHITSDGSLQFRTEYNGATIPDGNTFYVAGLKVAKSALDTGYSENPTDAASDINAISSELKQTTDAIKASVSSLDSSTVKTATLNLDNNGFVTKVGKTVNGNTFATMIAQNESDVQIIAKKMKVSGDMIVNGAITAEKLNVSNLSAVNSNLGKIEGGSLLLQENKAASSSIDSWGTFNRPAHKQGLYMDNHGLASSGAIQRKNGGETTPTDMPLAVLQSGELRFLVVDYNDNLENVLHYGLSDPDFGAIRFEIDSELKRRLTMTSSGYLNFQATNYTDWQSTGVSGCEYMIQGRLVLVNYDVTFNSAGTQYIGIVPQEFTKKSLMMTAKAWTITPRDKNIQLNPDGSLYILDAERNVNYRGTLVFSY
ncbi:Extracellular matrix-binding protein ebhB [Streptococcus gallolyticus]|uniref:Extracellular matrix-binding protein ebhB n=1 Tax=Streptococcus gallolyticus TaxID=315405 RepID=A0A380JZ54_9STRE|nr:Extracellular matrix-binding protein ebhB [Streptococcus gallolyticus]